MYGKILKRVIDVAVSLFLLIAFSWLLLIAIIAIKLDSKGPAIFKQTRLGLKGKQFQIYKFRSMVVDAEKGGVYSNDKDPRITRVGNILRKTSIDELPQLVNILKGDMSFIGPRPPLTYHPWPIEEYTEDQLRMFDVRPGLTGWAQVNGRKAVEWNKRIKLSSWYVDNLSLWLDIKILFMSVFKVLANADNNNIGETVVSAPAEVTAQDMAEAKSSAE